MKILMISHKFIDTQERIHNNNNLPYWYQFFENEVSDTKILKIGNKYKTEADDTIILKKRIPLNVLDTKKMFGV